MTQHPRISYCIVFLNVDQALYSCIQSLHNQSLAPFELLLISPELTSSVSVRESLLARPDLQISYPIRCFSNPHKLLASGWQIALDQCRGDFLIRPDAHSTLDFDYVLNLYHVFIKYESLSPLAAVGGVLNTIPGSNGLIPSAIALMLSLPFGVGNSPFRINNSFSNPEVKLSDTCVYGLYKVSALRLCGGFNQCLSRCQDLDLHRRLHSFGYSFMTSSGSVATYSAVSSISRLLFKGFSTGYNVLTSKSYKVRHIIPVCFYSCVFFSIGLLVSAGLGHWSLLIFFPLLYLTAFVFLYICSLFQVFCYPSRPFFDYALASFMSLLYHISYAFGGLYYLLSCFARRLVSF